MTEWSWPKAATLAERVQWRRGATAESSASKLVIERGQKRPSEALAVRMARCYGNDESPPEPKEAS